jgi:hypothetical protein
MQNLQQQPQQQGTRLAPELNRRLADSSIPLTSVVEWWLGERNAAYVNNGEYMSTSDMNEAEQAMFGIILIGEMCGPSSSPPEAGHPFETELRDYWADLEKASSKVLRNN